MALDRDHEIDNLLSFCVTTPLGCKLYGGQDLSTCFDKNYAYTRIKYKIDMQSTRLPVHRHMYLLCNSLFPSQISPNYHVSHLCHNARCVQIHHLSYEDATINANRKVCKLNQHCTGHSDLPKCIF